jgi:Tol biopolymer transport system component
MLQPGSRRSRFAAARRRPLRAALLLPVVLASLGVPSPAWASDPGRDGLIVFAGLDRSEKSADHRYSHLWLTSEHGNVIRQLTDEETDDGSPAWAPDGRRIAFTRNHEDTSGNTLGQWLHIIDTETGAESVLTSAGLFSGASWSPDASQIVFCGRLLAPDARIETQLFMISPSGGELRQLTTGWFYNSADPSWSPQGDRIAYSSNRDVAGSQIWLMNSDGSDSHRIFTGLAYAAQPDWSADGQWLVVTGVREGSSALEVYKMRPDGSELTQLTDVPEYTKNDPTWSPDGSLILFEMYNTRGIGTSEFFVVPASGGTLEQWGTHHLEAQASPDWRPLSS